MAYTKTERNEYIAATIEQTNQFYTKVIIRTLECLYNI